jgi:hypothetical protein
MRKIRSLRLPMKTVKYGRLIVEMQETGLSVSVNFFHHDALDTSLLASMVIRQDGRIIMRRFSVTDRAQVDLQSVELANASSV